MQSRFEFLEEQFPKLAGYGEKAEEALNSDNNICLFNLGRIAENITEFLRQRNHIDEDITTENAVKELLNIGAINSETALKINTLIEIKNEAAEDEYSSKMACSRLLTTAQELCEWFMLEHGESKFGFLGDLFFPDRFIPPLAHLAEIGREAEENLYTNTRYCLICLGDMGEAIVDYLISMNSIVISSPAQMDRIDSLFIKYIIDDDIKNALHDLRMARNKAVHDRDDNNYTSEAEGKRLLDEVLKLSEWLFKSILRPGYIVKGRITSTEAEEENFMPVLIGAIPAVVSLNENPSKEPYVKGKKYIFKVEEKTSEKIILRQADDYNINEPYSKYYVGQKVHVVIKSINNFSGALVELKDGLLAKIPHSEIARRLYDYDDKSTKRIKYEVTARVKHFSKTQYPPLILSTKDIEDEYTANEEPSKPSKKAVIKDDDFINHCKSATFEQIIKALDGGANPKAKNRNNNTALMAAAEHNRDYRVIKALLEAGADIEARNKKGLTALHFAAMRNVPDVVEFICKKGADIEALTHDKKTPLDYARSNKNINDENYIIKLLTPKSENEITLTTNEEENTETKPKLKEPVKDDNINKKLLEICQKKESAQEILELINKGANVNTASHNNTTPLMMTAQYNNHDAVKTLLEHHADVNVQNKTGQSALMIAAHYNSLETVKTLLEYNADVNAKNKMGNTALHEAAGWNTSDVIVALINAGADLNAANNAGIKPLDLARNKTKLKGSEAMKILLKPELQKKFLGICRHGSAEEISEAINAGVKVNSKTKHLVTALMFAARENSAEAVNILIEAGAHLNAQDIQGNTALIYAASENTEDVVEALINAGADITLKNTSEHSAYDYAKGNYRLADTEALKKLNPDS